jgi:hypothetical protein
MWNCPQCGEEHGDYNEYCEFCKQDKDIKVYNPNRYFIRDIRLYHLSNGDTPMTPQEEYFQKLFNGEVKIALAKTPLERKALREEACQIILHAKVTVQAVDHVDNEERKTRTTRQGLERDKNVDETTSNAVNIIKKRMSKKEQIQKQLEELYTKAGSSDAVAEAAKATSARSLLGVLNRVQDTRSVNPFAKKASPVDDAIAAILSGETAKLIISEQTQPQASTKLDTPTPTPKLNPFKRIS